MLTGYAEMGMEKQVGALEIYPLVNVVDPNSKTNFVSFQRLSPAGEGGAVELFSFMGFAGTLEVVGGALIMLGLFTRPTAFILSGMMAVAYFMSHFPRDFYPTLNGGDAAILFCFLFLYISVVGGGSWAIDAFRVKPAVLTRL